MKLNQLINEGRNTPCIVVDVQPEYTGINDGDELPWIDDMMTFLNNQGPVLMFVNAEEDGLTGDTVDTIRAYWSDSGFAEHKWNNTTIVDKGYGYFRGWMDQGVPDNVMIAVIREMYLQHVSDSRMLFGGEDSDGYIESMISMGVPEDLLDDAISVGWASVRQLKQFSGSYLMGGGREECLREITLLMNAFNIKYKLVNDFIYG